MLDGLLTALTIFAILAGSAVGWAILAGTLRRAGRIASAVAQDRRTQAGAAVTAMLLLALIIF